MKKLITLNIEEKTLAKVKELAKQKDIPVQQLLRTFINKGLIEEACKKLDLII